MVKTKGEAQKGSWLYRANPTARRRKKYIPHLPQPLYNLSPIEEEPIPTENELGSLKDLDIEVDPPKEEKPKSKK